MRAWLWPLLVGLVLVGSVGARVRALHAEARFWNFGYSYVAVRAVVDHANPYDPRGLIREDERLGLSRQIVLLPDSAQYPPSTLLLISPFSVLGWSVAGWIFAGASAMLLVLACAGVLWALPSDWPAQAGGAVVLAGIFAGRPFLQAMLALNMVFPCVGLLMLASILLRRGGLLPWQRWAGAAALAAGLALKPQVALGSALFLLWRPASRRGAGRGWIGFTALMLAGCGWMRWQLGSFEFLRSFLGLTLFTSGGGHQLDPGPANPASRGFLQLPALLLGVHGMSLQEANLITAVVVLGLAGSIWWAGTRGSGLRDRPWTMLALMEILVLLFVYHRQYDRVMALLLVPAVFETGRQSRIWRWGLALLVVSWGIWDPVLERFAPGTMQVAWSPVIELVMCGWMLAGWWWFDGRPQLLDR